MKKLGRWTCVLLLSMASIVTYAADAKDKKIDVDKVDVPEKVVIQPTSAEIHEDAEPGQTCTSCHGPNSLDAEKKPLTHFLTTKDCGTCHFNKSWVPIRNYTHMNGKYSGMLRTKPDIDPMECNSCHISNTEFQAR